MKIYPLFITLALASLFFFSCGDAAPTEDTTNNPETTQTDPITEPETEPTADPANEAPNTFNAKFVGMEFGDAAHFLFEDETGKQWDFGASMATNFTFEEETEDGGFGPNPELLGKTFTITYETKQEPTYVDGPVGDVMTIIKANLVE